MNDKSSLEKGMNAWLKNAKDNNVSLNEKQLKQIFTDSLQPYFLIALADQKAKIREFGNKVDRLINLYNENIIFRDKLFEEWLKIKKEFEELKL